MERKPWLPQLADWIERALAIENVVYCDQLFPVEAISTDGDLLCVTRLPDEKALGRLSVNILGAAFVGKLAKDAAQAWDCYRDGIGYVIEDAGVGWCGGLLEFLNINEAQARLLCQRETELSITELVEELRRGTL
jgi:hypothetical protein